MLTFNISYKFKNTLFVRAYLLANNIIYKAI